MADFCRVCTIELFGEAFADKNDMRRTDLNDNMMWRGLCEHCGPGWFDRDGRRVPSFDDACSRCGEPARDHYRPDMLKFKLGPNGTFGLKEGMHAPHIAGYHMPRNDG